MFAGNVAVPGDFVMYVSRGGCPAAVFIVMADVSELFAECSPLAANKPPNPAPRITMRGISIAYRKSQEIPRHKRQAICPATTILMLLARQI